MPPTPSVPQSITAVTLNVSSGSPSTTVSQTFSDLATLASLQLGSNSIQITDPVILSRYAIPGLQCSNDLSITYSSYMDVNSVTVNTPSLVDNFVATPLVLSNFGPSFTYNYVSGGTGTFTLPQPYSNGSSPGAFSYSVVGSAGIVSVSSNVATMLAAGSTTIRATQAAAGGYASAYVEASVTINPIAPTFSNSGVFTISSKTFLDAAFTPSYPTSNSLGAFTYTSSDLSVATVNPITGRVTAVAAGTTTIRATQAAAGGYASAYVEASFLVTIPSYKWLELGEDIDGEASSNYSGRSVSISADGTIVAIGADYNNDNGSSSGHVRVYQRDASKVTAQTNQSLPNFGPIGWNRLGADIDGEAASDTSGYSVSLSHDGTIGTIVAIGASRNDENGSSSGHVRVYKYDATKVIAVTDQSLPNFGPIGWNRLGADIDGEAASDYSGYSVSLSHDGHDGTIVAIGAVENDENGSSSGHVRVYKYDATKVTAQTNQTLPNYGPIGWNRLGADIDGEASIDYSGTSVSLSADGTIVAIGGDYNDDNGSDSGHVRVYKYDATKVIAVTDQSLPNYGPIGWNRLGADIDGEAASDYSGTSVSLSADGTIVAIGAIGNDENGSSSGHVRVYKYDATKVTAQTNESLPNYGPIGWNRLGADIDGEAASDYSGRSVSLSADGTIVAIGASRNAENGSNSGHVRVYKYDATKVIAVTDQKLPNFGPIGWNRLGADIDGEADNNYSGTSVSLSADGTIVAIGAVGNAGINGSSSGHVRVYKYELVPTFGTFTLPSDLSVYKNVTITRELTPPTSNSSGAFTITSSNTAVATITNNAGVYSINIIGAGSTVITATQAASGDYAALSITSSLVVTLLYPTFGTFTLPSNLIYTSQTITRVLAPPTSNSSGVLTITSSNTAVATITNNADLYSINVISAGYTTITVTQAASGDYSALSTSVTIDTITGNIIVKGFTVITDREFTGLDFTTEMTTLFTNIDFGISSITMPNSNFKFNNVVYNNLYISSNGWLSYTIQTNNNGSAVQTPTNTFRFFSEDHISTCKYKFDSNNTRLLIIYTGYLWSAPQKIFTIKLIISTEGLIQINYLINSDISSNRMIIGNIGSNSAITSDDTFLTINGYTFNRTTNTNIYNLLNGKTILYLS